VEDTRRAFLRAAFGMKATYVASNANPTAPTSQTPCTTTLDRPMTPLRTAVTWMARSPVRAFVVIFLLGFSIRVFDRPLTALAVTGLTILALLGAWRSQPAMTQPQRAALMIPLMYRVPVDWILLLLAGAAVWSWLGVQKSAQNHQN
jgi:hypothetical protein